MTGEDGLGRCPWAADDPALRHYHDTEWGVPVRGERALFERISLEAFQAGLSWRTILAKRPAFREAFHGFDPDAVARLADADIERLMGDSRIVRNRAKIAAARANARAVVALRGHGGLDRVVWSHRPAPAPAPRTMAEVPASSPESRALAADLRSRGLVFVGPTTAHALMEAIGLVDAHLAGCHRRGSSTSRNRRRVRPTGVSARPPARDGGLPPFERLVELHGPALLRFCAVKAGPDRADDCFQETMLAALRAYGEVRDPAAVRSWLFSIAVRKAIDGHRAAARAPLPTASVEALAGAEEPACRDEALWARVRVLPDKQRQALTLRYLADLTHGEIAEAMGTSEPAARRNVFEALRRLRSEA